MALVCLLGFFVMFVVSHCNCICSNHLGSILLAWPCASAQHSSWQRSCQEDLAQHKVSCSHEGFPREEAEAAISWWSAIHPHWLHAGGAVHDGVVWYTCGWQESVELCVFAFEFWSAFYFIHSWRGLAMFAYLRPLYVKDSIQMNGIALQRIDWGGPGPGWFGHKDQGASEFRTGAASAGPFAQLRRERPFHQQEYPWWRSHLGSHRPFVHRSAIADELPEESWAAWRCHFQGLAGLEPRCGNFSVPLAVFIAFESTYLFSLCCCWNSKCSRWNGKFTNKCWFLQEWIIE